jgi:hypothetical protein
MKSLGYPVMRMEKEVGSKKGCKELHSFLCCSKKEREKVREKERQKTE